MSILKRFLSISVTFALLCSVACASSDFESISQIKADTPTRWTQTYETKWRTVDIDVPVQVPDVDQFPVIRITALEPVDSSLLVAYAEVPTNEQGSLDARLNGYGVGVGTDERFKDIEYFYDGAVPDLLPEDSTLTSQEALDIANTELTRLFGSITNDLVVSETDVFSRYYHFKVVNKEKVWLDVDPNYPKGKYWIIFSQKFHGIGFQESVECYNTLGLDEEDGMCAAQVLMDIRDAGDYDIVSDLYRETETVYEDVPILPFEDAKAAVEEEIMAGHLRSIDTMELCYAPYSDPNDSSVFWLLPVWYVEGAYTRNASEEFTPYYYDNGMIADSGVPYLEVVYQAQLGKLMDYNDSSRSRRNVPKIYTWDDVQ